MAGCLRLLVIVIVVKWLLLGNMAIFAQDSVTIVIFRDVDSLTIYVPENQQVSLEGLKFQVTSATGEVIERLLGQYLSFIGLPFENVPTPICLRLLRDQSNRVIPNDCPPDWTLNQRVSDADVFWYDRPSGQGRLVLIFREDSMQGLCPAGQSQCRISYTYTSATTIPMEPTIDASAVATREASQTPIPTSRTPTPTLTVTEATQTEIVARTATIRASSTWTPTPTRRPRSYSTVDFDDLSDSLTRNAQFQEDMKNLSDNLTRWANLSDSLTRTARLLP